MFLQLYVPVVVRSLPGRNGSICGSGVTLSLSSLYFFDCSIETDESIEGLREHCCLEAVQLIQ